MSSVQEVVVLARLAGVPQFLANDEKLIVSQRELALATEETGMAMKRTTDRSWLMNQALFTMRRFTYMGTLALTGAGAAALKMGFDFNNAMQTATVALKPFYSNTEQLNGALNRLWLIAKYTPFQMKDMTLAFRALYPSFRALGISSGQTIDTIQALIDGLSVAGKVSGPALNRVTIALQHMAFQGRLTGITVNQLARDGIPLFAILHKELGISGDQMHKIGQLGIPASVAMQAIIRYMRTTPGYAGAAMRQSRETLIGLWSTFKDNVSRMMGLLEKGAFGGIQSRINNLDNWFNGFFQRFSGRSVSLRNVIMYAFGAQGVRFWDQITADLSLVWKIFSGIVRDVTHSRGVWIALYMALVALHEILLPINFAVQHFGWLITVLIPLLVAWKATTILMNAQLTKQVFLEALATKRTGELTFAQFLARASLYAYYFMLGRVIRLTVAWTAAQSIWSVLTTGGIKGATREWTVMEKAMLRVRYAWYALKTGEWVRAIMQVRVAIGLLTTSLIEMIPVMLRVQIAAAVTWIVLGGPIVWIIAAVVALIAVFTLLYFKVKWFHDAVNAVAKFFWDHPILLNLIPIIGQLLFAVRIAWYFKDSWMRWIHDVGHAFVWLWGQMVKGFMWMWNTLRGFFRWLNGVSKPLGFALAYPFKYLLNVAEVVFNWIMGKINWVWSKIAWLGRQASKIPGLHFVAKYLFGVQLQEGGVMRQPGMALVGERGPELLLLPSGAGVLPLPTTMTDRYLGAGQHQTGAPKAAFSAGQRGAQDWGADRPLVIQLVLNKKVIEEVTVDKLGARQARR
jgi:tape measure domain-containing protein